MNKNEELGSKILKTKYLLTYEANKLSKFEIYPKFISRNKGIPQMGFPRKHKHGYPIWDIFKKT